jgi:hypothetical protein
VKPKTLKLIDPPTTRREEAQILLRAKHYLLAEQAKRDVRRKTNAAGTLAARRDRRLVSTGEQAYEQQWRDPVATHPDAPQEEGFSLEVSERQYRQFEKRRRRQATAAYWEHLGPAPNCLPGDLVGAAIFHRKIVGVIERGAWTHNEQTTLGDLERKWRRRARGEDPRFVLAGNRPGRLHRTVERRVRALKDREG